MKKNIKFIGVIILLVLVFGGCKKENGKSHVATYEVVSVDGSPVEITIGYFTSETEDELGAGQEVISIDNMEVENNEKIEVRTVVESSVTRWQHKFTFYHDEFLLYLIATIRDDDEKPTQSNIIARIYVDDELMIEKQTNDDLIDPTVSVNFPYTFDK